MPYLVWYVPNNSALVELLVLRPPDLNTLVDQLPNQHLLKWSFAWAQPCHNTQVNPVRPPSLAPDTVLTLQAVNLLRMGKISSSVCKQFGV